jgi:hypothetical protein
MMPATATPRPRTGNDVVDLSEPFNARAHERRRLVERVLGHRELEAVQASGDPTATMWSFFAAKEAAYKLACKLGPRPVFSHRSFVVDCSLRWVEHEDRIFDLHVERLGSCLHAVASTAGARPLAVAAAAEYGTDPRMAVRRLLATRLARLLRCSAAMLAVVRDPAPESWDDLGPPRLLRYGVPVEADVSLSHDGGFVGFSACV